MNLIHNLYTNTKHGMFGTYHNLDSEFISEDSEARYRENCLKNPNWEYLHIKFGYKFNELGHRSVSPSLLEDDYILFLGCSYTAGIGLALEHTYADLVSKKLKRPYYNLAVGGGGPDIVVNNALAFLPFIKKKPHAIVIQWPGMHRFFHVDETSYSMRLLNTSSDSKIWEFMSGNNYAQLKNSYLRLYLLDILSSMEIDNVCEIFCSSNLPLGLDVTENSLKTKKVHFSFTQPLDHARDMQHPGIISNSRYTQTLLPILNEFE